MGAHVSNCPNHQTLRTTPLETRFAVAAMGVLGYECNLAELKKEELEAIAEQIALYKKWRGVLQYGQLYRIGGKLTGTTGAAGLPDNGNLAEWCIVSPDGEKAVAVMVQETVRPHTSRITLRLHGLQDAALYRFTNRALKYDIRRFGDLVNMISPVHIKKDSLLHNTVAHFIKMDGEREDCTVTGALLNHAGIALAQGFAGTGYGENTRLYQDFDARMYFVEKI
jgi:alpha-galactosidase